MPKPKMVGHLYIYQDHTLTYWSTKEQVWFERVKIISLDDICGLLPEERDRYLSWWRSRTIEAVAANRLALSSANQLRSNSRSAPAHRARAG